MMENEAVTEFLLEREGAVLAAVAELCAQHDRPVGPTEVGLWLGHHYNSASSATGPILDRLVQRGLVERMPGGNYRLAQRLRGVEG